MERRSAIVSGQFYPANEKLARGHIEECLSTAKKVEGLGKVVAGVVPHAGWTFSGPTAAKVFAQIDRDNPPSTFVLLGAVHRWGAGGAAIYTQGSWETPLGDLAVDSVIAEKMLKAMGDVLEESPQAHSGEHSIEVQLPFIAYLFPGAKIIPVSLPPSKHSHLTGERIGAFLKEENVNAVVIGTTDLTHYGPGYGYAPQGVGDKALQWVKEENDASIVSLAVAMKADQIVADSVKRRNACGAGAMAGTIGAAKALGAEKGTLLEYITSHDMMPFRKASDFVGYAGIVFSI